MASSGYLVSPRQDPSKEQLWTETWKRIDRFLPDLRSDLALDEEPVDTTDKAENGDQKEEAEVENSEKEEAKEGEEQEEATEAEKKEEVKEVAS